MNVIVILFVCMINERHEAVRMITHDQMINGRYVTTPWLYFYWLVQNINERLCMMSTYFIFSVIGLRILCALLVKITMFWPGDQ